MKLIELLVQELPKRGGWPEGVTHIGQDYDRELMFYGRGSAMTGIFLNELAIDHRKCVGTGAKITQEQYESALAASKKPAWNGDGLPPVGCECECYVDGGVIHCVVVGYDFDGKAVVMRNVPARKYFSIQAKSGRIKPLRTEAEMKRDAAVEAIDYWMPEFIEDTPNQFYHAKKLYDAIAAGKIPGVKLDD